MGTLFYFNSESDHTELDPEGTELRNMDHARHEAVTLVGQMLMNGGGAALWRSKSLKVWVTDGPDGSGDVLFTLQVSAT